MLRAVAYARFSSELQREESIDAQLRAIRKYCDEHDIVLLATYAERVSTVPRTTVPSSSA